MARLALIFCILLGGCASLQTTTLYDMDRNGHEHVHQDVTVMIRGSIR